MVVVAIVMVFSMTLMHEDVHKRAEQKNKKRQGAKQMSFMLGPEEEPGHPQKNNKRCLAPGHIAEKRFFVCCSFHDTTSYI